MDIVKLLENAMECVTIVDSKRDYIGASAIGHICNRKIWYDLQTTNQEVSNAMTLKVGNTLEKLILDELESLNVALIRPHIQNNYLSCKSKTVPRFKGHLDALLYKRNEQIVLEIKTAKNSSFNQFAKHGLKHWNESYYAQAQSYMGMTESKTAILLAFNKDTSKFHQQLVEFDKDYYFLLEHRAMQILKMTSIPPPISSSPSYYICKMCFHRRRCFDM